MELGKHDQNAALLTVTSRHRVTWPFLLIFVYVPKRSISHSTPQRAEVDNLHIHDFVLIINRVRLLAPYGANSRIQIITIGSCELLHPFCLFRVGASIHRDPNWRQLIEACRGALANEALTQAVRITLPELNLL